MTNNKRHHLVAGALAFIAWFAFWLLFGAFVASAHAAQPFSGRVVGVTDGDTLTVLAGGATQRIRLAEIDAPEKRQPFGERAKQSLAALCFNANAEVTPVQADRYGRLVARVACGGIDASLHQVQQGLAWAYTAYLTDPDIGTAERLARSAGIGLWTDPERVPPWTYRRSGGSQ
jgi:endonuclease YncB( thermonuclease family)